MKLTHETLIKLGFKPGLHKSTKKPVSYKMTILCDGVDKEFFLFPMTTNDKSYTMRGRRINTLKDLFGAFFSNGHTTGVGTYKTSVFAAYDNFKKLVERP